MEEQDEPNPEDDEEFLETLGFEETRVLGSLIEKELTTPEYYPMSLNGLVNACNQKNNRLPRSELSEEEVGRAIEELRIKRLVHRVDLVGSRVPKFQHNAEKELDLIKAERALFPNFSTAGLRPPENLTAEPAECSSSMACRTSKKPFAKWRNDSLPWSDKWTPPPEKGTKVASQVRTTSPDRGIAGRFRRIRPRPGRTIGSSGRNDIGIQGTQRRGRSSSLSTARAFRPVQGIPQGIRVKTGLPKPSGFRFPDAPGNQRRSS